MLRFIIDSLILALFSTNQSQVRRESDDFRLLRDMAYQRAQVVVTSGFGWPYMLPMGTKGTVKRVVRTVMKEFLDGEQTCCCT